MCSTSMSISRRVLLAGLLVAASAVTTAPLLAQIQPGRIYSGGEQISDPDVGLTLTLPRWSPTAAADTWLSQATS